MKNKVKHPLYKTWEGMMNRCYMKSCHNYRYYGAKGVRVDERWHNFWEFVEDVNNHLEKGYLLYRKQYQLDKYLKGGCVYSLENCVVVTAEDNREEKLKKQRKQILVKKGDTIDLFGSIAVTSKTLGIPQQTVYRYLKNGKQHKTGYSFEYFCNSSLQ